MTNLMEHFDDKGVVQCDEKGRDHFDERFMGQFEEKGHGTF